MDAFTQKKKKTHMLKQVVILNNVHSSFNEVKARYIYIYVP